MKQEFFSLKKQTKKHKRFSATLNYIKQLLTLTSVVAGCVSISAFASMVVILIGITSSAVGLRMCAVNAEIKKYESIINKKVEQIHILVAIKLLLLIMC